MGRIGKIARLPRKIRDELNARLDDGEPGVRLIKWLNGLPEVKQVLEAEFEGRPINHQNLSDWRNGGFLEWRAEQQARAHLEEIISDESGKLKKSADGNLVEPVTTVVFAHYAAAVYDQTMEREKDSGARVKRLGKTLRDLDRVRRRDHSLKRMEIDRGWLELGRKKALGGQKFPGDSTANPKDAPKPIQGNSR